MTKEIALDLDDTLLNLKVPLMTALNLHTNKAIHWKDWAGSNLEEIYGVTAEEFIDIMIKGQVIERALPIPGVREALQRLRYKGYNIHIITARGWHPEGYSVTKEWLDENSFPYDTINIVKLGSNKADVMDEIANVNCLIDDNEKNCNEVISRGYDAYLIAMPWNGDSKLKRISHLADFVDTL